MVHSIAVDYPPKVSVIVPTYNRPRMLAEALRSISRQTFQDFEIIVVNDCGIDVSSVVARVRKNKQVVYARHDTNKGLAAARNTGLRAASGKYVAYLDDDDIFYPNHLETLVTFLEGRDWKVAYTDAYRVFQKEVDGKYVPIMRHLPYAYDFDYDRILFANSIAALCFMHERSCVDKVGYFDETLNLLEDWDFWIRMSRNFKIGHVRTVTCEFRWREDGSTMTSSRRQQLVSATQAIYEKHRSLAASKPLVTLAQRLKLQYLRLGRPGRSIHGDSGPDILRLASFLMRKRGSAQSNQIDQSVC